MCTKYEPKPFWLNVFKLNVLKLGHIIWLPNTVVYTFNVKQNVNFKSTSGWTEHKSRETGSLLVFLFSTTAVHLASQHLNSKLKRNCEKKSNRVRIISLRKALYSANTQRGHSSLRCQHNGHPDCERSFSWRHWFCWTVIGTALFSHGLC